MTIIILGCIVVLFTIMISFVLYSKKSDRLIESRKRELDVIVNNDFDEEIL